MELVMFSDGTHIMDEMETRPEIIGVSGILTSIVLGLGAIACFVVITSILWSDRTCSKGFNLYLIFHLIPDACFNLFRCIALVMRELSGKSRFLCAMNPIITTFFVIANSWMSALIVYETYQLLQYSHQARRYHPSSRRVVLLRVAIVYVLTIMVGLFTVIDKRPFYHGLIDSRTCVIIPQGEKNRTMNLAFFFLVVIIPFLYTLCTTILAYKNKLLTTQFSSTRFLLLYFLWIAQMACGLPSMALVVMNSNSHTLVFSFIVSLQSIFVSSIAVSKDDIHEAVVETFCCCCNRIPLFHISDQASNFPSPLSPSSPDQLTS